MKTKDVNTCLLLHWQIHKVSGVTFQRGMSERQRSSEHILITHHSSAQFIHSSVTKEYIRALVLCHALQEAIMIKYV